MPDVPCTAPVRNNVVMTLRRDHMLGRRRDEDPGPQLHLLHASDETHVLLVEGNDIDAGLVLDAITTSLGTGAMVTRVTQLEQAVEVLSEGQVDVVLLDLSLPDSSGLDTLVRLGEAVHDVPAVIVLSCDADQGVAATAVGHGAQDYLVTGSLVPEVLARSIRYAIERHRLSSDRERVVRELEDAYAREQEVVEQLTELDRLKAKFVANAAHELRMPLTSITGFAMTLVDRWDEFADGERREFLRLIENQGHRLAELVDDLVVLGRIQADAFEVRQREVPVLPVVRSVIDSLGLEADVEVSCEDGLVVVADGDHLRQMLRNYLANARSYGRGPIRVEVGRPDESWVDLRVCDCGDGVPQTFVPRLFDEFERNGSRDGFHVVGAGLGLSVVRGLVSAHGGTAWYEDNHPTGAVFALRLPGGLTSD